MPALSDNRPRRPPAAPTAYQSSRLRTPAQPAVRTAATLSERTGPTSSLLQGDDLGADLTENGRRNGQPVGERIILAGRVIDEDGRPCRDALVEVWQANAAGRYIQTTDQHDAPLDPNFFGAGRCVADAEGAYSFRTIKPGAYPWGNHPNAWRPSHIHVSVLGPSFVSRLVTQMYFPGDPLLALDPIFNGVPEGERSRLVADLDLDATIPGFALAYRFDVVVRTAAAPVED